jgi:hypothetical protein
MDDLSSYSLFHGILIPPLAQSYVRSVLCITSEDMLIVELRALLIGWFMYVRELGYAPLSIDAGEDAAYLDDRIKSW